MCRYHPGLVCRQGAAGQAATPGTEPVSCLSFTLARHLLPTAQVQCAKPPVGPGGVSPDDHLLLFPLLLPTRPPRLKDHPLSLCQSPLALREPGLWSLQEKGNDSEPALSALCIFLGPGRVILPPPQPYAPLTPTLHKGRVLLQTLSGAPSLPD